VMVQRPHKDTLKKYNNCVAAYVEYRCDIE